MLPDRIQSDHSLGKVKLAPRKRTIPKTAQITPAPNVASLSARACTPDLIESASLRAVVASRFTILYLFLLVGQLRAMLFLLFFAYPLDNLPHGVRLDI